MSTQNSNATGGKARGVENNRAGKPWAKGTTRSGRVPSTWRDRTPHPNDYYRVTLRNLTRSDPAGWAYADCPFCGVHDCLGVDLAGRRGVWRCARCDAHGDMVSFHCRRFDLGFADTVRELLRWRLPSSTVTPSAEESMRQIRELLGEAMVGGDRR